jgi:hypothetical protein
MLSTLVLGLAGVLAQATPSSRGAFDVPPLQFPSLSRRAPIRLFGAPSGPSLVVTEGPTEGPTLPLPRLPARILCTMQVLHVDPTLDRGILRFAPPDIDPGIQAKSVCDK